MRLTPQCIFGVFGTRPFSFFWVGESIEAERKSIWGEGGKGKGIGI